MPVLGRAGLRRIFGVLGVLLLSIACGAAGPAATPAPTAAASAAPTAAAPTAAATEAPTTLTVALASNVLNAPFFLGVEKGFYLKRGIDLKLNIVASGADSVKGLQGGSFQFISTSWTTFIPAVAQGTPMKLFGSVVGGPDKANYDDFMTLMLAPGNTAQTIADLKGKTIAVAFGTAPETWLRTQLKRAGLDADKDVKLVNVSVPNEMSVLQSKGVDAGMPIEPYSSLILKQVPGARVLIRGGGIVDGRVNFVTTAAWYQANPKLVGRVLEAHLETSQWLRTHPEDGAAATARYLSGLDADVLASSLKQFNFDPRWSDKVQAGYEAGTQQLLTNGTIKVGPKATDILALDVLNNLEKTYPQYFTDLKK